MEAINYIGNIIGVPGINFKGLRATCATLLAQNGASESVIRDILGHHDTVVTRVYLAPGPKELIAAIHNIKVDCAQADDEAVPMIRK